MDADEVRDQAVALRDALRSESVSAELDRRYQARIRKLVASADGDEFNRGYIRCLEALQKLPDDLIAGVKESDS